MAVGVGKIAAEVAAGRAALIDVRPDEEWHESHAAPALHFELDRMMGGEMPPIPRDMPVYLYCRSGGRSEAAHETEVTHRDDEAGLVREAAVEKGNGGGFHIPIVILVKKITRIFPIF